MKEGFRGRGRPKKTWMDCVKNDLCERGVSEYDTNMEGKNMLRRPKMMGERPGEW